MVTECVNKGEIGDYLKSSLSAGFNLVNLIFKISPLQLISYVEHICNLTTSVRISSMQLVAFSTIIWVGPGNEATIEERTQVFRTTWDCLHPRASLHCSIERLPVVDCTDGEYNGSLYRRLTAARQRESTHATHHCR